MFCTCSQHLETVNVLDVPLKRRDWFIVHGYRKDYSLKDAALSLFFPAHNEFLNIWTHLTPTIFVWPLLSALPFLLFFGTEVPLWDRIILSNFGMMCLVLVICSTVAHTFNCHYRTSEWFWYCDYMGIAAYGLTSGTVHTVFCDRNSIHSSPEAVLFWTCFPSFVGFLSLYCAIHSREWGSIRYVARLLAFGILFFTCHSTVVPRLWTALLHHSTFQDDPSLYLWGAHFSLYFVGAILMTFKIPERWAPGKFDLSWWSHPLWHALSALGTVAQFAAVLTDYSDGRWNSQLRPPPLVQLGVSWLGFAFCLLVILHNYPGRPTTMEYGPCEWWSPAARAQSEVRAKQQALSPSSKKED
eukprot:GCRY01001513.1.p1 GENE.GCRY01001513.1~~GCRY01001513.1.p1  ORF type:complete len:356 (+),score=45.36 GCRY01001513.1:221-1288(+)